MNTKSPDFLFFNNNDPTQSVCVDAYNGSGQKIIEGKIGKYTQAGFRNVFVFSSQLSKIEQLTKPMAFKFHPILTSAAASTSPISSSPSSSSTSSLPAHHPIIQMLSDLQFDKVAKEFSLFYTECFYWETCYHDQTINRSE